jgi:hypothetical protein
VGKSRMSCVADNFIDARWRTEAAPDKHTENTVANPRIRVC